MFDERNADLIGYLPPYYHDDKEMVYITDAENPEMNDLWNTISVVKRNQFILDADEFRIRQWEKLLRIKPDYKTQSLEHRKAVVIIRLSTMRPLTYRWLVEKVKEADGTGRHLIDLIHDLYHLTVRLDYEARAMADEFYLYLREKIPANLCLSMEVFFKIYTELNIYTSPFYVQVNEKVCIGNDAFQGSIDHVVFYGGYFQQRDRISIGGSALGGAVSACLDYGYINVEYDKMIIG